MIDKYSHIGVTRALRRKLRIDCREAARLLYQARQLGKAAEFIWRHRADADPNEIVNMGSVTRWQANALRQRAHSLLMFCDEEILLL